MKRAVAAFSLLLAVPIFLPALSPVRDVVAERLAQGFHFQFSRMYLVFAPFCVLADTITILSLKELILFVVYVLALIGLIPMARMKRGIGTLVFLVFLAWGALAKRPTAKLVAEDTSVLLIDFHSHTAYSHDGRRSFTPKANMEWHKRQGFGAAFITDHNASAGAQEGARMSLLARSPDAKRSAPSGWWPFRKRRVLLNGYSVLRGEEVSLYRTHLGVLGNSDRIDNAPYDSSFFKIPAFIDEMHHNGYLVVAHLPEYWRNHWARGNMDFLTWKVDGFEIVNSVPYCLDFPPARRREIIAHCRRNNLFVTGVSDSHGWGYATAAWSVMKIPDWSVMEPETLEKAVLAGLKNKRFGAVQVLERARFEPETIWGLAISPIANLLVAWRHLGVYNAVSCILWLWLFFFISSFLDQVQSR